MLRTFIRRYAAAAPARFHTPGHKGFLAAEDITEVSGADNLLQPAGIIARAQERVAGIYGARHTFFLTNGATGGVLAMLLALPPARVAVARNAHQSVYSGLALAGHTPEYLPVEAGVPSFAAAEAALARGAAAVLLTRPDYLGRCFPLAPFAAACRARGAALLVDEAHGSHLALCAALPESAARHADLFVNSAHKTLYAPNQAAYLHVGVHGAVAVAAAARAAALVQTTSPAYPLLAALEEAPAKAQAWDWGGHLARLAALRLPFADPRAGSFDATRLVLDMASRTSGAAAHAFLAAQGVEMEMHSGNVLVGVTSPVDPDAWYHRLGAALAALPQGAPCQRLPQPPLPEMVLAPRAALARPCETLPLAACVGRVAARPVAAYPPGCALAAPGERLDEASVRYALEAGVEEATVLTLAGQE